MRGESSGEPKASDTLQKLAVVIGTIGLNSTPDFGGSFCADAQLLTSLTAFGAVTLEVVHQHEKLVPESGVQFMAPISGAGFWSVCQGSKMLGVNLEICASQKLEDPLMDNTS